MADSISRARGERESSWLVLRRGLAVVCRLLRGPATKDELLVAVRESVDPEAYSDVSSAAERALKHDRAVLKRQLGIQIRFDRRQGLYELEDMDGLPWLDLGEEDLAAIAVVYNAFDQAGPEATRVRAFLDRIVGLLPEERSQVVQQRRRVLTFDLRELDEAPISPRVMQVVRQAVIERRRLGFRYRAAGQSDQPPRYHEVEPYGIVFKRGHYYLECFDLYSRVEAREREVHEEHRDLRLQGIVDDEMLCVLPEKLPPGRRRQKRYPVCYRLAPLAVGHGVSRHFTDMQVERQPDGSVIVEATTANPWEAARALLHYGENCIVLGGSEVLREMHRCVAAMAKNYDLLAFEVK